MAKSPTGRRLRPITVGLGTGSWLVWTLVMSGIIGILLWLVVGDWMRG